MEASLGRLQARHQPARGDSADVEGLVPATEGGAVDIDEAFTHHIGEMGRHQMKLFAIVSLPWLPGALLTYVIAFVGVPPSLHLLQQRNLITHLLCQVQNHSPTHAIAFAPVHSAMHTAPGPLTTALTPVGEQ